MCKFLGLNFFVCESSVIEFEMMWGSKDFNERVEEEVKDLMLVCRDCLVMVDNFVFFVFLLENSILVC